MEKVKNNVYKGEHINSMTSKVPMVGKRVFFIKQGYLDNVLCKFGHVTGIVKSVSCIGENKFEITTEDKKKYTLQVSNYLS